MAFRNIVIVAFPVLVAATGYASIVEPPQPTPASTVNVVIWWVPCSAFTNYSIAGKIITVNFSCASGGCVLAPYHRINVGRLEAGQYTVHAVCNGTELVSTSTFTVSPDIPVMQPAIVVLLAVALSVAGTSILRAS